MGKILNQDTFMKKGNFLIFFLIQDYKDDVIDKEFLQKYDCLNDILDEDEDFSELNSKNFSNLNDESLSNTETKLAHLSDINLKYSDNHTSEHFKFLSKNKKSYVHNFLNGGKASDSSKSSIDSAEKITKSIFETTNSKLSMDILDSINMGKNNFLSNSFKNF